MKRQRLLALDLDDCIADWISEASIYLQQSITDGYKIPLITWKTLTNHHRFYKDLKLLPGARELVTCAKNLSETYDLHLAFLTALPHSNDMPYAAYDKVHWAEKHFPGIPVFFGPYSADKHTHCRPGDILIDDRKPNCDDWSKAGGIAHQYTTWAECKLWIDDELVPILNNDKN